MAMRMSHSIALAVSDSIETNLFLLLPRIHVGTEEPMKQHFMARQLTGLIVILSQIGDIFNNTMLAGRVLTRHMLFIILGVHSCADCT